MSSNKDNILFLGQFFPQVLLSKLPQISKVADGFSNHNFEMSLIKGFSQHEEINLTAITLPHVYSYPRYNRSFFTRSESYTKGNVKFRSIGFCNVILLNRITSIFYLTLALINYFKSLSENKVYVVVNTPKFPLLMALFIAKMLTKKKVKTTLIIPDIPSMITNTIEIGKLKGAVVGIEDKWSIKLANRCDGFVLLTDAMKDFLRPNIQYIVMEGLIDDAENEEIDTNETDVPIILYTGTLHHLYGIRTLLRAFQIMKKKDVELWICGSGDTEKEVKEAANTNANIKYYGLVSSDKARQLQRKATVLVNPRPNGEEYTKYSFPSKNMEYLLTGKIVVFNRLPGIPEDYSPYYFAPTGETAEALADTLDNVLNMTNNERVEFGKRSRAFIKENKNTRVQTGKIIDLMKRF